ncbi:MAG: metallophosphoesterase family protein [Phycisphaerae bacterium]
MKIGLLSDSHGKTDRVREAAAMLVSRGAEHLVHCGDINSIECVHALAQTRVPCHIVAGNTDRHVQTMVSIASMEAVEFDWEVVEVPLGDGEHLVATHGHDQTLLNELVLGGQFPYVCHGHTHKQKDERIRGVHVINPGALYRARRHTVALLDTESDTVEFIEVE